MYAPGVVFVPLFLGYISVVIDSTVTPEIVKNVAAVITQPLEPLPQLVLLASPLIPVPADPISLPDAVAVSAVGTTANPPLPSELPFIIVSQYPVTMVDNRITSFSEIPSTAPPTTTTLLPPETINPQQPGGPQEANSPRKLPFFTTIL